MKLLKSKCEKAWLFDTTRYKDEFVAGLACFLPGCEGWIEVEVKEKMYRLRVPKSAAHSPVPVKVSNARLSLLISASHE